MTVQAEEFVTLVERDELSGVLQRAAAAHPSCLLNLIVDGLYHYMEVRERREFRSGPTLPSFVSQSRAETTQSTLRRRPFVSSGKL